MSGGAIAQAVIGTLEGVVNAGYGIYNNERNWKAQQENLAYQKALQERLFSREDNAIQRRVADLKAAGINPLLASGGAAGAGAQVSTQAPHSSATEFDVASALRAAMMTEKQMELVQAQIDSAKSKTNYNDILGLIKAHDYKILRRMNILSTSSGTAKDIADIINNVIERKDNLTGVGSQLKQKASNVVEDVKRNLSEHMANKRARGEKVQSYIRGTDDYHRARAQKKASARDRIKRFFTHPNSVSTH